MDIAEYTGYFHDGSVIAIINKDQEMWFELESAVILDEWDIDGHLLSPNKTIKGWLVLYNISKIVVNNEYRRSYLKVEDEEGEILDLEIENGKIIILIEWTNYKTVPRHKSINKIEIEAKKTSWIPFK